MNKAGLGQKLILRVKSCQDIGLISELLNTSKVINDTWYDCSPLLEDVTHI